MIEFYPQIKMLHVSTVVLSGSLFFIRGIGVQLDRRFAMAAPVRYTSYTIDTVLLVAALSLVWALHEVILGSFWIWAKIMLLPVYIFLGSFALKRAATKAAKLGFFIAAVLVFLFMYRVARTHDPFAGLPLFQ